MTATTSVTVSDEQLLKELAAPLRAGVSLDRYVEARRTLGLAVRQARRYAAASEGRARSRDFQEALDLGLRPNQILGLIETRRSLVYITTLMKRGGATLDEAVEAWGVGITDVGGFSYTALRQRGASHRSVIDEWATAAKEGVRKDFYMAYRFAVKLTVAQAIEITRTELDPVTYVAAVEQGFEHDVIVNRDNVRLPHMKHFVQQIKNSAGHEALQNIQRNLYNDPC